LKAVIELCTQAYINYFYSVFNLTYSEVA
jgi:hypothetical protein